MRMTVLTYEADIATTRVLLTWKVVIRRWQTWTFQKCIRSPAEEYPASRDISMRFLHLRNNFMPQIYLHIPACIS
jgi:hypothetical protein